MGYRLINSVRKIKIGLKIACKSAIIKERIIYVYFILDFCLNWLYRKNIEKKIKFDRNLQTEKDKEKTKY
jgi:hypothetical protein